MTNEILAVKIKAGEAHLMDDLWTQVKRFVYRQAHRFYNNYKIRCGQLGLDTEDLFQEGYIAIHKAVEGFNAEQGGTFLTYAGYHLKSQFYEAAKMRSTGWQKNTVYSAVSLDAPANEASKLTMLDQLADTSSEDTIEQVIEQDYLDRLANDLAEAMVVLTDKQAYIIKQRYFNEIRPIDIANELGVVRMTVNNSHTSAIKKLKEHEGLQSYYSDPCSCEVKTAQ